MSPRAHEPGVAAASSHARARLDSDCVELRRNGLFRVSLQRVAGDASATQWLIRQLLPARSGDPEARSLLERECAVGQRLQSPYVIGASWLHEPSQLTTVQPYVEGLTLEQLLSRRTRGADARFLIPALVDVLEGLAALHDLERASGSPYVHQAPTPRHILVGFDGVARLCDFTQVVGAGFTWNQRIGERLRPEEMAPEQALASAHVGVGADIFIAGTTLWHVLLGEPLFGDPRPEQALQKMLRMTVPTLSEAGVPVSARLERLVARALVRARSERLRSAAEFADTLRRESQQAGLWAAREELGQWVRALRQQPPVQPTTMSALLQSPSSKATLVGVAPMQAQVEPEYEYLLVPRAQSGQGSQHVRALAGSEGRVSRPSEASAKATLLGMQTAHGEVTPRPSHVRELHLTPPSGSPAPAWQPAALDEVEEPSGGGDRLSAAQRVPPQHGAGYAAQADVAYRPSVVTDAGQASAWASQSIELPTVRRKGPSWGAAGTLFVVAMALGAGLSLADAPGLRLEQWLSSAGSFPVQQWFHDLLQGGAAPQQSPVEAAPDAQRRAPSMPDIAVAPSQGSPPPAEPEVSAPPEQSQEPPPASEPSAGPIEQSAAGAVEQPGQTATLKRRAAGRARAKATPPAPQDARMLESGSTSSRLAGPAPGEPVPDNPY